MFLPSSLSCQPSPVLADRGATPLTNDQICDLIAAKIAEFRLSREYALFNNRTSTQTNPLLQPGPSTSQSALVVRVPQTPDKDDEHSHSCNLTSHRCDVTDARSPDEESLRSEVTLKPNKDDSGILSEVAATCEKDEQSPVVLTTNCEKLMKSCLTLSAGSLQKDKTLDDKNGEREVGSGLEFFQQKKGDAVEEEGRVVRVAVTSRSNTAKDDPRKAQQNPLLTLNQQLVHSMSASSVDEIDKAGSPCSHLQNPTKEVEQNYGAQSNTGGAGCVSFVMNPLYDNISDEEPPGLTKTSLQSEQYEDENVIGRKRAGLIGSILPVLSEASREPLENTQGETVFLEDPEDGSSKADAFNETEIHSCQCSVEPAADSEHHVCLRCSGRDLGVASSQLYGPCSVLNKEADDRSDEGEDSEDDWEVIPVSILDLKFEPLEKQPASGKAVQDDGEHGPKIRLCGLSAQQRFALKPLPASAFAKIAVFDTPDDQEQASRSGQVSYVTPSCHSPKQKLQMDMKELCSEPEDGCDTDDSFTYSSGPECNYMTVPKELLESLWSPGRRKTDRCLPKMDQDVQKHRDLTMVQNRVGSSDGVINLLDSEEEAEAKMEKRLSQTWENWGVPSCTQQMGSPGSRDSGSEDCVLVEDEVKQNDENVVIILSDSEDESRENYNRAKKSFTADPLDCGRAASSTQGRNAATAEEPPTVLRRASADSPEQPQRSKHKLGYQSSGPRVSSQESAGRMDELSKQREVGSPEAESNDDFPNDGKDFVPKRKKLKMTSCDWRLSAEADSTVSSTVIPRLFVREFKSDELVKDVGECREPNQDPCKTTAKSSAAVSTSIPLKEKLRFLMNSSLRKPASPPSPTNDAHRNACRRIMYATASKYQRSHSSDSPSPSGHAFVPARFPSGPAPVQSMQGTHHARNKVHTDWQRQHVPLRREKKYKRKRGFRRPL